MSNNKYNLDGWDIFLIVLAIGIFAVKITEIIVTGKA